MVEEPETSKILRVQMSERALAALNSAGVLSGVNVLLSRPSLASRCVPSSTRYLCQKARERRSSRRAPKPAQINVFGKESASVWVLIYP